MATIGDTTRPEYIYDSATDTWIPVGIGPHSHTPAAIGAIASSIVTTKGDIIAATGSGVVVRQGVGADGSYLVADSSQADGLNYASGASLAAGKNAIINGGMDIWQRGTTFTNGGQYTADRWFFDISASTVTSTRESTIVPAGFQYSWKLTNSAGSATATLMAQTIETANAIQFASKTVTLSFYAAADSATTFTPVLTYSTSADNPRTGSWTNITPTVNGSTSVSTTTFVRIVSTFAVPSTAKSLFMYIEPTVGSGVNIYVTGFQLELGSVATPFARNASTIQGELAACQRYYTTSIPTGYTITDFSGMNPGSSSAIGWCSPGSSNDIFTTIQYPVPMRTTPTFNIYSAGNRTSGSIRDAVTGSDLAVSNYSIQTGNNKGFNYMAGFTATTGRPYSFQWVASAEL
jgi:hypothetical protein